MTDDSSVRTYADSLDDPPNSRLFLVTSKSTTEEVFIAQSRSSGSHRDVEDEELTRIFIMIPKTFTEEDLKEKFKVKRNCYYRAILAEPKNRTSASCENDYFSTPRSDHMSYDPGMNSYPFAEASNFGVSEMRGSDSITKCLLVSSRASLSQEQMFNLFDLIPGLDHCEMQRDPYGYNKGQALVRYNNVGSAVYAKEKLHGFEYPPGNRLVLTYIEDGEEKSSPVGMMALQLVAAQMMSMVWSSPVGQQFMKTSSIFPFCVFEFKGYSSGSSTQMNRLQTDVSLPPHRKLAPADSRVKERLFIVFNPAPLSVDVLEDVFCRFGSLIEVYIVQGRNVGYIKFADRKSANEAMITLHGKVINGVKLKVMLADPPKEESHKRQRTY
ncbi:RNA-binding protein 45 [Acipenser ruthenus]|uniref:RNA-binding protein 45 n=1 Tax=Acipenser ruthenus TaxID=7906 RepID=A0A444TZX1_ACIRT|nr:RNA-binding protein 45 [Acipenser ruthenus]